MDDFDDSVRALQSFADGPAFDVADDLARAFEAAGDRISTALERAARSGEFSFNDLASSVAQDLTSLAIDQFITGPITSALTGALGGLTGGGSSTRNTTVNLNVAGMSSSQGVQQSQGQISAAIARAVASGQRYI